MQNDIDMKKLGAAVARWRCRLDMTQRALADHTGLSLGAIGALERGLRAPTLTTAAAVARALGVSVDTLLGEAKA